MERPLNSLRRHLGRLAPRTLPILLAASGLTACGDDSGLLAPARIENASRTWTVYALTGTSIALPAGYLFTSEAVVRPQLVSNGTVNFEMAFDLTTDGRVRLLPAAVVSPQPPGGVTPLGIVRTPASYAAVGRAPDRGYVTDTTYTASPGDTFLLQLPRSGCTFGEPFYAKMTIDSVFVDERRIVFSALVNRNCGYRSLATGLPRD